MNQIYMAIGLIFALFFMDHEWKPKIKSGLQYLFGLALWVYAWPLMLFVVWALSYITYRMMIHSAVILRSAGKMKTGNDLGEQVEDTLKNEKIPSFWEWRRGLGKD